MGALFIYLQFLVARTGLWIPIECQYRYQIQACLKEVLLFSIDDGPNLSAKGNF